MTSGKWIALFLSCLILINPAQAIIKVAVASDNGNEPANVTATVDAINACPDIEAGK